MLLRGLGYKHFSFTASRDHLARTSVSGLVFLLIGYSLAYLMVRSPSNGAVPVALPGLRTFVTGREFPPVGGHAPDAAVLGRSSRLITFIFLTALHTLGSRPLRVSQDFNKRVEREILEVG